MSTITIFARVEVSEVLENLTDEDLVDEVRDRGLKVAEDYLTADDTKERLQAIHHQMRMGNRDAAYNLMDDFVRDALGKAV